MMNSISRNKRRSPHAFRSAVGIFICASNGIGPAQYALILRRRAGIERISLGEQRIDTADRIRSFVQAVTGLPDTLVGPMRQLGQALAEVGSLPADPTNEPTKEQKQ